MTSDQFRDELNARVNLLSLHRDWMRRLAELKEEEAADLLDAAARLRANADALDQDTSELINGLNSGEL